MRKWVWRLFPPSEVIRTIEESKAFFRRYTALSQAIIEPEVLSLIKNVEETRSYIRVGRMTPDQLALVLITDVVGKHLASGAQHIYLGVLGAIGTDMLAIWHQAKTEMFQRGYATESEVAEDNRWVSEQIHAAGWTVEPMSREDSFAS